MLLSLACYFFSIKCNTQEASHGPLSRYEPWMNRVHMSILLLKSYHCVDLKITHIDGDIDAIHLSTSEFYHPAPAALSLSKVLSIYPCFATMQSWAPTKLLETYHWAEFSPCHVPVDLHKFSVYQGTVLDTYHYAEFSIYCTNVLETSKHLAHKHAHRDPLTYTFEPIAGYPVDSYSALFLFLNHQQDASVAPPTWRVKLQTWPKPVLGNRPLYGVLWFCNSTSQWYKAPDLLLQIFHHAMVSCNPDPGDLPLCKIQLMLLDIIYFEE